jgi:hypothetical protein
VDKQQRVGDGAGWVRYEGWELPVLVGLEYAASEDRGWLLAGETGYVLRVSRAAYSHEPEVSATDHGVGVGIGGGYRVDRLQARAQLFLLDVADPVKNKALVFGLQWRIPM